MTGTTSPPDGALPVPKRKAGSLIKVCHNCRRRRLRCDKSWPACHKCTSNGITCLGYGKLYSFADAQSAPPSPAEAAFMRLPSQSQNQHQQLQYQHQQQHDAGSSTSSALVHSAVTTPASSIHMSAPSPALTDPLFHEIDANSRLYLDHFANRVCQDLVARDEPHKNPFRQLIPLTGQHPLLLNILVATSALHWVNVSRPRPKPNNLTPLEDPTEYIAQLRTRDPTSQAAYVHALEAKQKALTYMRQTMESPDGTSSEVALAALHFFIKADMIDAQRDYDVSWQSHLIAAGDVFTGVKNSGGLTSEVLRDCLMADCFIYHIFGSTLSSGAHAARIARHGELLLPVMDRVAASTYLSCPSVIMEIILKTSQLAYELKTSAEPMRIISEAFQLLERTVKYDVNVWAEFLEPTNDIGTRIRVASAHRAAAILYILQAMPTLRELGTINRSALRDEILSNVTEVKESDPHFKALCWPCLMAGGETWNVEKRKRLMKYLMAIWEHCPWGYVFTAMEMLKATWEMQDLEKDENPNWLEGLKSMGFNYLIV